MAADSRTDMVEVANVHLPTVPVVLLASIRNGGSAKRCSAGCGSFFWRRWRFSGCLLRNFYIIIITIIIIKHLNNEIVINNSVHNSKVLSIKHGIINYIWIPLASFCVASDCVATVSLASLPTGCAIPNTRQLLQFKQFKFSRSLLKTYK